MQSGTIADVALSSSAAVRMSADNVIIIRQHRWRRIRRRKTSVCLSVTFVYSVETSKHRPIFKIFSPSGSHTILCFSTPSVMAILRRVPPNWGKNRDLRPIYLALASTTAGPSTVEIGYSTKRRSLLIAGNGRSSSTHRWILFMTESLGVTSKTTEHDLIIRNGKSEAKATSNKKCGRRVRPTRHAPARL